MRGSLLYNMLSHPFTFRMKNVNPVSYEKLEHGVNYSVLPGVQI